MSILVLFVLVLFALLVLLVIFTIVAIADGTGEWRISLRHDQLLMEVKRMRVGGWMDIILMMI